jgi:hypothetical protein
MRAALNRKHFSREGRKGREGKKEEDKHHAAAAGPAFSLVLFSSGGAEYL